MEVEGEVEDEVSWCPGKTAACMKRLVIQKHFKQQEDDCAICLEQMFQRMCEYLPCTHVFHYNCFKKLIDSNNYTCPLCRYNFKDTLLLTGIQVVEELQPVVQHNFIFTNMDVYDFVLELLWQQYQINANTQLFLEEFGLDQEEDQDQEQDQEQDQDL